MSIANTICLLKKIALVTLSDSSTRTPSTHSDSTTKTEVWNEDNNSNIQSIDLSKRIVNQFNKGNNTEEEIGPFMMLPQI